MPARTLCVVSRCELGLDSCRNCWFLACHGVLAVGGVCAAAAPQIAAFAKKPAPATKPDRSSSITVNGASAARMEGSTCSDCCCCDGIASHATLAADVQAGVQPHVFMTGWAVSLGEGSSWLVDVGRQFEKVDEVDGGTGSKCRHRGRVVQCVGLKQHCGSHCRTVYELC